MAERTKSTAERRGLGAMGRLAWQPGELELVLLPRRDDFTAAEAAELSGLKPAQLRTLLREFPSLGLAPTGAGAARRYRRAQVEQLLRLKRLRVEQGLPIDEVERRLQAAAKAPARSLPEGPAPRKELPAPAPAALAAVASALSPASAPALPAELLGTLRSELEAIVALCQADD